MELLLEYKEEEGWLGVASREIGGELSGLCSTVCLYLIPHKLMQCFVPHFVPFASP